MPLTFLTRLLLGVLSILWIALAAYLLWSWQDGRVVADPAGEAVRVYEDWRLWGALGLIAWSLLGHVPLRLLLARGDKEKTKAERVNGAIIDGADGARLYVESHGPADAPTLVLTHGWGLDSTIWYYARRALADRFRVVVWDLPGLGRSRGDISLEAFARDLGRVVEWTGGPVILVGHSIGGMTIQTLIRDGERAVREQVKGVVLLNTTYTNPLKTMIASPVMRVLRHPVLEPLMGVAIGLQPVVWLFAWQGYLNGSAHLAHRLGFGRYVTRSQLDHTSLLSTRNPPGASARGNLAMFAWDATDAVRGFDGPLLVVTGHADIVTLPSAGQAITTAAPQGRRLDIEGVNHMGLLERHDLYNAAIAEFAVEAFAHVATPAPATNDPRSGLAQGGLGHDEDQLLEDGQEEVFSRAEVESGLIEHHADTEVTPDDEGVRPPFPAGTLGHG